MSNAQNTLNSLNYTVDNGGRQGSFYRAKSLARKWKELYKRGEVESGSKTYALRTDGGTTAFVFPLVRNKDFEREARKVARKVNSNLPDGWQAKRGKAEDLIALADKWLIAR